jgi:hypothetical protein
MNIKISTGFYVNRVFTQFEEEPVWHGTLDGYIQELLDVEQNGDLGISMTENELRSSLQDTGVAEFCGGGHAAFKAELV